jgi:hypothetical protein
MGIFLGDKPVTVFFNGAAAGLPVQGVFLGGIQVFPAGAAATDTALLLNFNGADESTTFTDSSPNGFTVTAAGGAELSTSVKKYGTASGNFTGAGARLSVDPSSETTFASGDFTIECWLYVDAGGSGQFARVVQQGDFPAEGGWALAREGTTSPISLQFESYAAGGTVVSGGMIPDNEWTHVAVTRHGSTYRLFINGELEDEETTTEFSFADGALSIGANSTGDESLSGYIDDFRILKGRALYTANFTPPAAQLGVV